MADVVLYYLPTSFYSQKAKLYLLAKGINFEERKIFLDKLDHLQPEYLRVNSKGQVPVIGHNGQYIADTEAIAFYCEEHFKDNPMIPAANKEAVLEMHRLIHDIEVVVINMGCITNPELSDGIKFSKEAIAKMVSMNDPSYFKKLQELKANSPPDVSECYDKKLAMMNERTEKIHSKEKIDAVFNTVHDMMEKVENQLKISTGNNVEKVGFIFGGSSPTLADLDLWPLLFRLNQLGLENRFFKITKEGTGRPFLVKYSQVSATHKVYIEGVSKPFM